jgi:hypothetical protein
MSKKFVDLCNNFQSVTNFGFSILDLDKPTLIYNDNEACVKWSPNMISKAAWHIELCKNSIHKWVQDKTISIKHVAGKTNPADIFTKEMRNGVHSHCLRDSFMCPLSGLLKTSLLEAHHAHQCSHQSVTPLVAWVSIASDASSYFSTLAANTFCWSITAMSHLFSAGRQHFQGLDGFIPPDLV